MNAFHSLRTLPLLALTTLAIAGLPARSAHGAEAGAEEEFFEFDEDSKPEITINDPFEGFNRASFAFNDKLYRGVLKPVAKGFRVVPEPARKSLSNFFNNLGAPISSASALLQGEPRNALTELGRFVINTTVGIVGLLDPATDMGLVQDEEDLGQTMGKWGIGHGAYLVVPFIGSSSVRDFPGNIAGSALNPIIEHFSFGEQVALRGSSTVVDLSLDKDTYEAFYDSALDPYAFFRSAWVQNRQGKIEK